MSAWSYRIVAVVFSVLAAAFLLSTASMIREFWGSDLVTLLSTHSYLFVFFPTLGLVALAAFYIPAVVFTDIYLTKAPAGPYRFAFGFLVAVGLSLVFAADLNTTTLRSAWEVSPEALATDQSSPPRCLQGDRLCVQPVLPVLNELRQQSLKRIRISPFIRDCSPDDLMEPKLEGAAERYCFPANAKLNARDCCRVQEAFAGRVYRLWQPEANRSQASRLDLYLLPFKAFFIIVIVLIGIFLIAWKHTLWTHYGPHIRAMERGLQIGAVTMLFWPIMDYAYQQTSDVLYGPKSTFPLRLSLVVVPWALLLTFYFANKVRIELARAAQVVGGAASGVAVLRYQDISDWSSKIAGPGAATLHFFLLAGLCLIILVMLIVWLRGTFRGEDAIETEGGSIPPDPGGRPLS